MEQSNITAVVREWQLETVDGAFRLSGKIYEDVHGRFVDGTLIISSAIKTMDVTEKGGMVYTRNSVYKLVS